MTDTPEQRRLKSVREAYELGWNPLPQVSDARLLELEKAYSHEPAANNTTEFLTALQTEMKRRNI